MEIDIEIIIKASLRKMLDNLLKRCRRKNFTYSEIKADLGMMHYDKAYRDVLIKLMQDWQYINRINRNEFEVLI